MLEIQYESATGLDNVGIRQRTEQSDFFATAFSSASLFAVAKIVFSSFSGALATGVKD